MVQVSYGDLAQTHLLRRQTASAKAEISRLSQEVTTGLASDTARHLAGNMDGISALDASLARLGAYRTATTELSLYAGAMQAGLGVVSGLAETAAGALLPAEGSVSAAQVNSAALAARQGLDTMITTLNSRLGDRNLFAGRDTAGAALIGSEALLSALDAVVAGQTTASGVQTAVADWFTDPAGFAATAYLGGEALAAIPIAEGESAAPDVTAADPALRDILQGLALGALLDRGLFAGQPEARRDLAGRAGQDLTVAQTGLTYLSARLGATEARIDEARTRNGAEATALGIARNELLGIDAYDSATALRSAETQLDLLFTLTARIARLSLSEYI